MPIMPNVDHLEFLRERALKEREKAATTESNSVAKIHLELADRYEKAIAQIEAEKRAIDERSCPPAVSAPAPASR